MLQLTTFNGEPVLEIEDASGRAWPYRYRVRRGRRAWTIALTALDRQGRPSLDRQGNDRSYAVTLLPAGHWCSCPAYRLRCRPEPCKHILACQELRKHLLSILGGITDEQVRTDQPPRRIAGGALPA